MATANQEERVTPVQKKAFAIVEILEMILLGDAVDMQTLLVSCQRVNRHWRSTITSSTPLQRKLYLEPDKRPDQPKIVNPLLVAHFPDFFNGCIFREHSPLAEPHSDLAGVRFAIGPDYNKQNLAKVSAITRAEDASWRRMHLRQPPVYTLGFDCEIQEAYVCQAHDIQSDTIFDGVKMGLLYDLVWYLLAQTGLDLNKITLAWLEPGVDTYRGTLPCYNQTDLPAELDMGTGPGQPEIVIRQFVERAWFLQYVRMPSLFQEGPGDASDASKPGFYDAPVQRRLADRARWAELYRSAGADRSLGFPALGNATRRISTCPRSAEDAAPDGMRARYTLSRIRAAMAPREWP